MKFKVKTKLHDDHIIEAEHFTVQSGCVTFYKGSDEVAVFNLDSFVSAVKVEESA